MKKVYLVFVGLVVLAMLAAACVPAATPAPTEKPAAQTEAPPPAAGETPAAAPSVIKVGALYPLTGPDAGWAGDPYIKSHQLALDEVNAEGGIPCLNGAKLELVKGDTQGKAEAANSEMERLITKEGVIAVMGSALSGTTLPASEISEKYQVPYIVPNALDGLITDRGMKNVFQTVSTLQQWGADDAQWAKDNGVKTAVITVPNFTFGAEVEDTWKKGIAAAGIELLDSFTYEATSQDYTDTILRVKQLDPDAWFLLGNNQAPQIVKQAKEQGYYPKLGIITLGGGFSTTFFLNEVGGPPMADGIIVTSDFAPVSKLNVSEEFKKKFVDYTGQTVAIVERTTGDRLVIVHHNKGSNFIRCPPLAALVSAIGLPRFYHYLKACCC